LINSNLGELKIHIMQNEIIELRKDVDTLFDVMKLLD
jgi:hypothetical protein